MTPNDPAFAIEASPFGRIVVAPDGPLFYTTRDFHGRLDHGIAAQFTSFIGDRFGIDCSLSTCTQVHGPTVRAATRERRWRECDACDALYTVERGVALGIKVADCLPVTLLDPPRGVMANIHSGWRGAVHRITAAAVDVLKRETPLLVASARAYLGPSIRACCFEVGEEVAAQFDQRFVDRGRSKPHVNIVAFTIDLLRHQGFSEENIVDSGLCTRCEGSIFHSFRRDGSRGGRNLAIAAQ